VTLSSTRRIGAIFIATALFVAACGGSGATQAPVATQAPAASDAPAGGGGDLSGTVTIDGSSTVFPITQAVAEEFQKENTGVRVPVAFAGTGGGFKKFCAGEIDINDASRPIKTEDEGGLACKAGSSGSSSGRDRRRRGPTGNDFATCLTVDELAAIYGPESPENLLWSDVRADFPAESVERFMPGADSGTFDYFTEEINGETDAATTFATQSEDDNTLVTGVAGDVHAIAFFGYAYYVENTDKLKAVGRRRPAASPRPRTISNNSSLTRPCSSADRQGKGAPRPRRSSTTTSERRHLLVGSWPSPTISSDQVGMGGRRRRLISKPAPPPARRPDAQNGPAAYLSTRSPGAPIG
jgi:phosphate transport system substrate-binding protein